MSLPRASVLQNISSLIEQINGPVEKTATELGLSGEGKQDPGGWKGPSTHPSARAASNVQKTPLGARAKENESDVKKDHPIGVDSTTAGSGGSQDDKQMNLGTEQSSTGEDPKVEDHYKGDKDDKREGDRGGTSGPFDAERIGEKYSSMQFPEITKLAYAKLNKVLTNIAEKTWEKDGSFGDLNGIPGPKKPNPAAHQGAMPGAAPPHALAGPADQKSHLSMHPTPPKMAAAAAAAEAGYALADLTKQAAVQEILARTISDAELNAQLTYDILTKYAAHCDQLYKRAEDGPMPGAMGAGDDGSGGGPPGGGMPPGMDTGGGPPPGADAGGPPPGADAGGPPGGEGGGAPAGQVDEIISALLQMGATPEEVMHSLQNATSGGGAGGPPGADAGGPPPGMDAGGPPGGGMPPGADKAGSARLYQARHELYQYCKAASERFRSGQWVPKQVRAGTKEAETRQQIQNYILEVVNAGR